MGLLGLGTDIIEVKRIEGVLQRHGKHFLEKVFTEAEQEYCMKHKEAARHFAGRFAAKEALVKALGTGLKEGISWLDFEITNDAMGKPQVKTSPKINTQFNNPHFLISISHCKEYATATAIHLRQSLPRLP